ncbi:hypothetical protein PAXINDRAFT_11889 [Paxillus involutus ATCC 200175]|uniref:Uncharacterized protein n=1 Tax=Paxillus involutus ATCC 200175 TaxID=664439 RepID=A0A0C9TI24_PAXIN|nr:hypothetical protein PAXINDRAFT_11889 [Paxillus involutus ATCC 200175]
MGASKPKSTKKSTKQSIDPEDAESAIDSARLSRLSDDLGSGIEKAAAVTLDPTPSTVLPVHLPGPLDAVPAAITVVKCAILDENHKTSVAHIDLIQAHSHPMFVRGHRTDTELRRLFDFTDAIAYDVWRHSEVF